MRTKPLMFKTPKAMERKIDKYFEETASDRYTVSGLCLYLRCNKDTFYEYGKREGYKDVVDYARLRIENSYEMDLREKGRSSDIFAMKNFGWKDKMEVEAAGGASIKIDMPMAAEDYLN